MIHMIRFEPRGEIMTETEVEVEFEILTLFDPTKKRYWRHQMEVL